MLSTVCKFSSHSCASCFQSGPTKQKSSPNLDHVGSGVLAVGVCVWNVAATSKFCKSSVFSDLKRYFCVDEKLRFQQFLCSCGQGRHTDTKEMVEFMEREQKQWKCKEKQGAPVGIMTIPCFMHLQRQLMLTFASPGY